MASSELLPIVEPLEPPPDPETAFLRLARLPHCLFLDSAIKDPQLGRYSFLAADPFDFLRLPANGDDALATLAARWSTFRAETLPELPPFQGGWAGLFGYELGRSLERAPAANVDEFHAPALAVGCYDVVLAVDHVAGRAWIISQGFPEIEPSRRRRRAAERLRQMRECLEQAAKPFTKAGPPGNLSREQLAPQYPLAGWPSVTSNFSRSQYLDTVRRVIDYIRAGDVFQVNLSQRLTTPAVDDAVALYRRLRRINPAPMAGYFDLGDLQVASASPERFLTVRQRRVETRPIKGTRPRTGDAAVDRKALDDLVSSEKDRAENVMIVDLLRNDLSRVCEPDSVRVAQLCGVETYQYVFHLVSSVCGRLRSDRSALDLLRAAFPGGSITGAPKPRAMQIIAELEPTARGPYCGSLGYLGFDGAMDTSLLIRTITAARGWWQFPVGGGIVAQSDPEREYDETLHKAEGLLQAVRSE
ncbi:MAG: aminodeoxychorismate synthase component I [Thermoguttaceae bacterium]